MTTVKFFSFNGELRKRGIRYVSNKLRSILNRCEYQSHSPEACEKLLVGLNSATEKHVEFSVHPRTLSGYKKVIEVDLKELRSILGPGEAVQIHSPSLG
jgi:hypothetical protein